MTIPQSSLPAPVPTDGSVPLVLRFFDCVLVVLFVPFALLVGLPALGSIAGAAAWIAQRAMGATMDHMAVRSGDARTATGMGFASAMLRPLLLGLTILALGQLGEREDGLVAAILTLVAFTVYMVLSVIFRPRKSPK